MNKVVYKDESKNIPGFPEALEDDSGNFMWDILSLMDQLYKVINYISFVLRTSIQRDIKFLLKF